MMIVRAYRSVILVMFTFILLVGVELQISVRRIGERCASQSDVKP